VAALRPDRPEAPVRRVHRFFSSFTPSFDNQIQHWNKKKIQHRRHNHPAEHGGAHGVPAIFARASSNHERHYAKNERQRSHQNRPQTYHGSLYRRFHQRHSAMAQLLGKLHDQNRVLARESHQHHQSDLAEHVILQAANPLRAQRPQQRHRHCEQHNKRQHKTFILRRQRQIDNQRAQPKQNQRCPSRRQFLQRKPCPTVGESLWHFLGQLVHRRNRLP
jgi:hypothetical protein